MFRPGGFYYPLGLDLARRGVWWNAHLLKLVHAQNAHYPSVLRLFLYSEGRQCIFALKALINADWL